MKILVISDLHIGDKARSKDLCPTDSNNYIDLTYKQDFIDFVKKENIKVDYLLVSGDISSSATYDEFTLARTIINDISTGIGVEANKVIIIPGNHDVDWSVLNLSKPNAPDYEFRKTQRYDTIRNVFSGDLKINSLITAPYFSTWNYSDLFVIGYNSACNDGKDEKIHHGLITSETIHDIEKEIHSLDLSGKYKIFTTHHHLYNYSDAIPHIPDFSIMTNADNLLKMLSNNNFDIVIHGHKHIPQIKTLYDNCIHPLPILCAGSFSVLLGQELNGLVFNMFHIINIEGRDSNCETVFGFIENYSFFTGHKWKQFEKSNRSNIIFKHGFGAYNSIPKLKKRLIPIFQDLIASKGVVQWSYLCEQDRELSYHTPDFIVKLTEDISKELNLNKYHADMDIIFTSK